MNQNLEIKASIQVLKPVSEVFEAIVDPVKMTNYFISRSTGRLDEGKEIIWHFPEFDEEAPIRVEKIINDSYISFYWENECKETFVEINLKSSGDSSTVISITEKSMENNEAGIKWLKGNTEGWANFLACLKAYLEYAINLRKGAFDYRFNC